MLISVHIPKTGGQSFKRSLRDFFVKGYKRDSHQGFLFNPIRSKWGILAACAANGIRRFRDVRCVHGHFPPVKYRLLGALREATFITWMRDPIERLASLYHHSTRNNRDKWMRPLHRGKPSVRNRMLSEGWPLERFCFAPEMRNVYSRCFWGFPFERFDFIGITEHFEEDLAYFAERFLRSGVPMHRVNVNPDRKREVYIQDPALRRRLEAFHDKDMALYRRALEKRRARMETFRAAAHV